MPFGAHGSLRQVADRRALIAAAVGFWLLALGGLAAAGEFVVLSSDSAALAPGHRLSGETQIALSDSERLSVISDAGAIITLEGPFEGTLPAPAGAPAAADLLDVVTSLLVRPEEQAQVTAAARLAPLDLAASVWSINAGRSGSGCALPGSPPWLRRPEGSTPLVLTLVSAQSGEYAGLHWSDAAPLHGWPAEVGIADGARYRLVPSNGGPVNEFVLRLLPADIAAPLDRMRWMARQGCRDQARALLLSLR